MAQDQEVGVHHVVWCVHPESLDRLRSLWEDVIGVKLEELDLPELGVKVLISWQGGVEIMAPVHERGALVEETRRFLSERGEGVYTVVVNVRGIDGLVDTLLAGGASLSFRETISAEAVRDRGLSEGSTFSIRQAGFDRACGMPICLQEIDPG